MDSFIYALVLVPSLRDLLPRSGIAATKGNIGYYGGLLFALFLIGWGLAFLWGPLADRFGRVRVLMLAILCYSLFTFLGALGDDWWSLRCCGCCGIGIGGNGRGRNVRCRRITRKPAAAGVQYARAIMWGFLAALANYRWGLPATTAGG
jgi:MFS family permease